MKVNLENIIDKTEYEDFVSESNSTFYQSYKHLSFLTHILKTSPQFITLRENDKLIGVLPFFVKDSKFGKVVNSLPFFGSYGGMITSKHEKEILDFLNYYNKEQDVLSCVIIENPFFPSENIYKKFFQFTTIENRRIQVIDLINKNSDELWNSFEQRVRRAVRKSQKLKIHSDTTELKKDVISNFFKMHEKEMQAKNGRVKPLEIFEAIKNNFVLHEDYDVFFSKTNDQFLSFLLVFYYGEFTEYYMPAYDSTTKDTQSTSLLIWNSIKESLSKRMKYYNFGGTWRNQPELYRFKRGWNATEFNYNYYIFCDVERIKQAGINEISKNYTNFYVAPYDLII